MKEGRGAKDGFPWGLMGRERERERERMRELEKHRMKFKVWQNGKRE